MKKICVLLMFFAGLHGLTTGNLIDPFLINKGIFFSDEYPINFRTGIEGFWVYNARLNGPFKKIQMAGCLFQETFNIKERADIYLKIGPSQLQIHPFENEKQTTSYQPLYIGGFKVELMEIKDTFLGLDVQYGYFKGSLNKNQFLNAKTDKDIKANYKDWQITGSIVQKIGFFYPYLSVACENIKLYLKNYPLHKRTYQSH